MKFTPNRLKKLTLLSTAGYLFLFAIAAKVVFLYEFRHPGKRDLPLFNGIVKQVRLGGQGKSTWFLIESEKGTYRFLSYYGKVWPGMERIHTEDRVQVLAERDRLNKDELITGKKYYIWELTHNNHVIVAYSDVRNLVEGTETTVDRYVNGFLVASAAFLLFAYIRKKSIWR